MKKLKIIKLKIIRCTINQDCWYTNKIGKSYYFFDTTFNDDGDNTKSIWKATVPNNKYAYLQDTNYDSYTK